MGLFENSQRGVWSLTEDGTTMAEPSMDPRRRDNEIERLRLAYIARNASTRQSRTVQTSSNEAPPGTSDANSWKEELLRVVMEMSSSGFERLSKRLLREADFDSVNVIGGSGDGGIDGLGIYRLGLLSFPVFFQCKRYSGSVGPNAVRDFRGAMAGRGDKGLLITTGTFTSSAKKEATRDGAPPIDLVDGDRLCDLLKRYEIGVSTMIRQVEDVLVDASFFADI